MSRTILSGLLTLLLTLAPAFGAGATNPGVAPDTVKPVEAPTKAEQLAAEALTLTEHIQTIADELENLNNAIEDATGDRREVLILERQKTTLEALDELFTLALNLQLQDALDQDTSALRDRKSVV